MSKISAVIKEEVLALIPPTIFFFLTIHIVMLVRVLMLEGTGISPVASMSAALAALILGKAVLIADLLPFINLFPHRPLIYNVSWKTLIYVLLATLIHYLERLIEAWRKTGGLATANQKLLAEMIWPHFWGIEIILLTLILMYCMIHELGRAMGKDKMRRIFFGPLPIPDI